MSDEVMWRRDGTPVPVEYSSFPILDSGKITGAVVTVADITERKLAEERLRQSEQLFRSIFENAQIGISFFNVDTRVISPNRALQEMLGYTENELSRLNRWDEISHPDERASCAERYSELALTRCHRHPSSRKMDATRPGAEPIENSKPQEASTARKP